MPVFSVRMMIAALALGAAPALVLAAPLTVRAADAPAAAPLPQAVQDYIVQMRADRDKAGNEAVAKKMSQLTQDPASPVLGNPNGDITIVEFSDYQCPFCKAAEPRLEQLLKDDKGVRLVVKEFPILQPESPVGAKAALAAMRQGKYEAFHQAMMLTKGRIPNEMMWEIAKTAGLDVDRLKKDMDAPEIADQIIANMNLARSLKFIVTPGFIVGGKVLSGLSGETETSKIDFVKEVAEARAAAKKS